MSLAKLYSRAIRGMNAPEVVVEVHVAGGLPSFSIVGLPDTEVKESRDRVRSAIQISGFEFPARRITVNLAPADLPKESGRYDLPIALGILCASGLVKPKHKLDNYEFAGELALDGSLRKIYGALPMAYGIKNAKRNFILPEESANEAALIEEVGVIPVCSLRQVVNYLNGEEEIKFFSNLDWADESRDQTQLDFNQVKGQMFAKGALEIAASGKHSLLMIGNPGCGKSMLAQRILSIMPSLSTAQAIESASIHSLVYGAVDFGRWKRVPLRSPHHSSSSAAIVGGGANPKPGEISLAHNGVLFMDELPEFERKVLEVMREPMEAQKVSITRARHKLEFPANFQLIAAMNPCPCGQAGNPKKVCKCSVEQINRYTNKISGPILDRIDLVVQMPQLAMEELESMPTGDSSVTIKQRVEAARTIQLARQDKLNYDLTNSEIGQYCILDKKARDLLSLVTEKLGLSARSYYRLLKVARTIADLEQKDVIMDVHMARAVQYKVSI